MVEICAIASGSNGNCYYIGNDEDAILVDVGISRKQVLLRMAEVNLDPRKIRAVFISHEHADHMRGVKILSKVLNVPVYMTKKTFDHSWNPNKPGIYRFFEPGIPVGIESIVVHPFLKKHDAIEPCSFNVEVEGKQVGVYTDIGDPCDNLITHFKQCDAMFLESNYDEGMLWAGSYPYYLKQRVASEKGHLSNKQAVELLEEHGTNSLSYVFLSHLSQDNNSPITAKRAFSRLESKYNILLTSRTEASELILLE